MYIARRTWGSPERLDFWSGFEGAEGAGGGLGGLGVVGLRNEPDRNMSCQGRVVEESGIELGSEYGTNSIAVQMEGGK